MLARLKTWLLAALGALLVVVTLGAWRYRSQRDEARRQRDEERARRLRERDVADGALRHAAEVRESELAAAEEHERAAVAHAAEVARLEQATTDAEIAAALRDVLRLE